MSKQLAKDYPVGKEIDTLHPYKNEFVKSEVVNHWTDSVNHDGGVVVRIDEPEGPPLYQNISSSFLREDGTGIG